MDLSPNIIRKSEVSTRIINLASDLQIWLRREHRINDHFFDGLGCRRVFNWYSDKRSISRVRTSFVVVYTLMQAEARIAELIYLVCVFDIVTNLVFNHPGRVDKTVGVSLYRFIDQQ